MFSSPSMELSQQDVGVLLNNTRDAEVWNQLLDNSRRTNNQVEALVTVAAALLLLQLVLGTWKRRWHNIIVSGALSLCNASLLPLVFYTLSIMQSAPVNNFMYPVWGASLLMAAGGTNAVSQFDYDEKKNKAMTQFMTGLARYVFYFFMLLNLPSPYDAKEAWTSQQPHGKISAGASAAFITVLLFVLYFTKWMDSVVLLIRIRKQFVKKIAKFHHNNTGHETTEEGHKYQVSYAISCLPRPKFVFPTIGDILGRCGNSKHGETLEDVCLSLALCQLFIQRYKGLSSAQVRVRTSTAHHVSFKALLQNKDHYERAFRIIEAELGFCYDFFFTKYPLIYFGMPVHFSLFILRVIFLTLVLVYPVQGYVAISTPKDYVTIWIPNLIVEAPIRRADYIITLVILGTALVVELLQALVYLGSDWIKVSLACQYVKDKLKSPKARDARNLMEPPLSNPSKFEEEEGGKGRREEDLPKPNAILEKLIVFFSGVTIFSPRRSRVAQHRVILLDKFFTKFFPKCNSDPVEISPGIEKAIAESIEPTFGEQNNRLASKVRNNMFKHLALKYHWTLKDHSQVQIMLIWHIATDYCYLSQTSSSGSGSGSNADRDVAVTLSRYCAYLLAFLPQLLPYNVADISELIDTMKEEIAKDLSSSEAPSERYRKMKELGDNPSTVFRKGVKLGKELEKEIEQLEKELEQVEEELEQVEDDKKSGEQVEDDKAAEKKGWKAMADFWAKTIIYIAPSHITAKEHMRQLENGGEFLTHIWALLTNIGMLNLVRDDDEVATPTQAQETV